MPVPETMRAVRLHAPRDAHREADLRLERVPTPRPGPGQVLVRVQACGVEPLELTTDDGSGRGTLPVVLGREAAGVVAALGEDVGDWQPGDRVAVTGAHPCGRCAYCMAGRDNLCLAATTLGGDVDGAHATFVVADARELLPVPPEIPIEQAALVTETVAVPYHALKRGGVGEGVTASVHGLGARGLHAILLARLTGAHVIAVGTGEQWLARALDWGADEVVDAGVPDVPGRVHELSEGGVDRAFEFTGRSATLDTAVRCCKPGGRTTVTGRDPDPLRTVPMARLVADELELVGSGRPTTQDIGELLDLLADQRLDLTRSVTRRLPLDEVVGALTAGAQDADGDDAGVRTVGDYADELGD